MSVNLQALINNFIHLTYSETNMKGKIAAVGQLRHQSKSLLIADTTLLNADGKEMGYGTGRFAKSRLQFTEIEGYK